MTDEIILKKLDELIGASLKKKDITTADFWGRLHSSLEKDIPQETWHNRDGVRVCPKCSIEIGEMDMYCHSCGQRVS